MPISRKFQVDFAVTIFTRKIEMEPFSLDFWPEDFSIWAKKGPDQSPSVLLIRFIDHFDGRVA